MLGQKKQMEYTYKSPIEKGYTRIYLSKKQHKELFGLTNKISIFNKCDYFICDHAILIEERLNLLGKLYMIVIFPLLVIEEGRHEALNDVRRALFQTKYGSFSQVTIFNSEVINKVKGFIK